MSAALLRTNRTFVELGTEDAAAALPNRAHSPRASARASAGRPPFGEIRSFATRAVRGADPRPGGDAAAQTISSQGPPVSAAFGKDGAPTAAHKVRRGSGVEVARFRACSEGKASLLGSKPDYSWTAARTCRSRSTLPTEAHALGFGAEFIAAGALAGDASAARRSRRASRNGFLERHRPSLLAPQDSCSPNPAVYESAARPGQGDSGLRRAGP
jgi:hypothetical protein